MEFFKERAVIREPVIEKLAAATKHGTVLKLINVLFELAASGYQSTDSVEYVPATKRQERKTSPKPTRLTTFASEAEDESRNRQIQPYQYRSTEESGGGFIKMQLMEKLEAVEEAEP